MKTTFRLWICAQLINAILLGLTIHSLYQYAVMEAASIIIGLMAIPLFQYSLHLLKDMLYNRQLNAWGTLLTCAPGILVATAVSSALAIILVVTMLFHSDVESWMFVLCLPSVIATAIALLICRRYICQFIYSR